MKKPTALFSELPITSIHPAGWIRDTLERQRDGLTGHLEVAGFPFNTRGWLSPRIRTSKKEGRNWWPYEQYAYWIDGMYRCGRLLDDKFLLSKAERQLRHVFTHADRDGYLGPASLKTEDDDKAWTCNRWPHAVLFRACMAGPCGIKEHTMLQKLTRHYLSKGLDHSQGRDIVNVEIMVWLFLQTGNRAVLRKAETAFARYQKRYHDRDTSLEQLASAKEPRDHGVNFCEIAKLGAVLYLATGNKRHLHAAENGFRKLKTFHVLASGAPSSTEHLRGNYPLAGHETCTIADYAWSLGYLLMATGKVEYADAIERLAFNAAPGAVTPDFKALQYFSGPNQLAADRTSNHHPHGFGSLHVSYRPQPGTECCPGNVNRIYPNFAARMWMRSGDNGLTAVSYGPSSVDFQPLEKVRVRVSEETDYPFDETIRFTVHTRTPATWCLRLRIPGWCRGASLEINGKPWKGSLRANTFAKVRRVFADGDVLMLRLPMRAAMLRCPGQGRLVEHGPLVMSLPVKARRKRDSKDPRASRDFPAWNQRPIGKWNFAIVPTPAGELDVIRTPVRGFPWEQSPAPIRITVPAKPVPGWVMRPKKRLRWKTQWGPRELKGEFLHTPDLPAKKLLRKSARAKTKTLELVPYGCTQLRVTVFPSATQP